MAIAIIIEDGTQVVNANSYVDLATVRSYALNRGVALSVTDDVVAAQLILAKDYIESKNDEFVGSRVTTTQVLSWPRQNVLQFDGSFLPTNTIPQALKDAQCQLVIEQFNGIVLMPTTDPASGGFVTHEKVDVLETTYSERVGTTREPIMRAVDALLKTLLSTGSGIFAMQSIRL